MIDIKLSTCAPLWPWARQTPGGKAEWGPFRFHIDCEVESCDAWVVFESLEKNDFTNCPPERVIFIAGEPDSIGSYQTGFLKQFSHVVSGRDDLVHPHQLRIQQGHPWFVEKSYDELLSLSCPDKTRDICVISSDKAFTSGHRDRIEFVKALKAKLGDRVDVYGRGIRDFDSKWNLLLPYRYAIVLENFSGRDFLTEKLPDALLAYCLPLYFGCTNVDRYLKKDVLVDIDICKLDDAVSIVSKLVSDKNNYENKILEIGCARNYYLNNLQFFPNLTNILQALLSTTTSERQLVYLKNNLNQFGPSVNFSKSIVLDNGLDWFEKFKFWR